MTVNCLADGIQVDIAMNEGILKSFADHRGSEESLVYVKGYSGNPQCRKSVPNQDGPIDFKVKFGNCGLTHSNVSILTVILAVITAAYFAFPVGRSELCISYSEAHETGHSHRPSL